LKRLAVSFSGGETSGYMTYRVITEAASYFDEVVVVFANTSFERDECLDFVHACDKLFSFRTVWVEAVIHDKKGHGVRHRVVSYENASRDGSVFESYIAKHGIPNTKFPSCTRDLKLRAMDSYLRSIGWATGKYYWAVGIRADEIDRMSSNAAVRHILYPLVSWWPTTKPQINTWWAKQAFRLRLRGYEGNCKTCWKKSLRKHFTLIDERRQDYDFFRRMEAAYGYVGPEFAKPGLPPGYKRVFFRGNKSTEDLFAERAALGRDFVPAKDDSLLFDPTLDVGGGCGESCEVFADGAE